MKTFALQGTMWFSSCLAEADFLVGRSRESQSQLHWGNRSELLRFVSDFKSRISRSARWSSSLVLLLLVFLLSPGVATAELPRLFYLNSYHAGYGSSDEVMLGIQETLANKGALKIHFLDSKRQPSPEALRSNSIAALSEIKSYQPNVLIVSDDDAVKYVLEPHYKLGPMPVVFCGVNWSCAQYGLPTPNVTGMIEVVPIRQAIRAIQRQRRSVKRLAILSEDSTSERSNRALMDGLYRNLGLDPVYMLVTDFAAWKRAFVRANSETDIVYLPTNGAIQGWDKDAAVSWVREHIRVPVITCDDFMMPYCVLGVTKVAREQGEWAARAALSILEGIEPSAIALATNSQTRVLFNQELADALGRRSPPVLSPDLTRQAESSGSDSPTTAGVSRSISAPATSSDRTNYLLKQSSSNKQTKTP